MGSKNQHSGISTWSGLTKGVHHNNNHVDADAVSECERVCGCEGVCVNRNPNPVLISLQVSNEMLSLAVSQTRFSDVPPQTHGVPEDHNEFELLRAALRNMTGRMKSNFKERHMFPLLSDMWFYSENISDEQVQLQE